MTRFGYLCECDRVQCRERIHLDRETFVRLSRRGVIVTAACAREQSRNVLIDYGTYVVAATSRAVDLSTRLDRAASAY